MSPDDEPDEGQPSADDVPPPKIIKVEDFTDVTSPYRDLDGETLARRDGVVVVRLAAKNISDHDGDGWLIGTAVADLTYLIGELGGHQGDVRVREVAFKSSVDLGFTTAGEITETFEGGESKERFGARRLLRALASLDVQSLLEVLRGVDQSLAVRLEELLHLLVEYKATLDMQTAGTRPIRVSPERAHALYNALREPIALERRLFSFDCRLVGATADTKDFKLKLHKAWNHKLVIEGKFVDRLGPDVERLFNREVLADGTYEEVRRGLRGPEYKFTLEELQPAPRLL